MKTKIFAHKGIIGIQAGNKFINDPGQPGQFGCVVDVKEVEINQEAFDCLQQIAKGPDSLGDIMCWSAAGKNCFGWIGGPMMIIKPDTVEADRDYNPDLLKDSICELEIPKDFKDAVDAFILNNV